MMWWLLVPIAIIILAVSGRGFSAILLGLFFDVLYGPPVGLFSFIPLPFTLLALAVVLARAAWAGSTRYRIPRRL